MNKITEFMETYKPTLETVKTHFRGHPPSIIPMEVDLSLTDLYGCITKQFENRVVLIRDHINPEALLPTIKSMSLRYNNIIVNVREIIEKATKNAKFEEEILN